MPTADLAVIYGTRPEVIKLAPVIRALRQAQGPSVIAISTHQHTSLLAESLSASHVSTDIETPRPETSTMQDLISTIGSNLQALELDSRAVVVQGDTATAYAGALFGFLNGMQVIHVEAGLRTSTVRNPFPEEGLRRLITRLTDLHLAPTVRARKNLEREGVASTSIVVTGNTSIDGLMTQLHVQPTADAPVAEDLGNYCVVTLHRRESWGEPMDRIALALKELALAFPRTTFMCPLHPNPTVRRSFDPLTTISNVKILDPLAHDDFVRLLRDSCMIITDSGGIQEESTVLGVPTLVARDETERPEAVEAGVAHLVGTDVERIVRVGSDILRSSISPEDLSSAATVFGDGQAGVRSARAIRAFLSDVPLPSDMEELDP